MAEAEHFVDKHQLELIKRVSNAAPVLDELLNRKVISQKTYDQIGALRTSQEKMRALCSTCLKAGTACKDVFYKILEENEPHLIAELKGEKDENVLDKVEVETMTAKKKLSETLNDLSSEELEEFKSLIELEKSFPLFSRRQQKVRNTQDVVELMVETYRQECVELTKKVLKKMNRTDLVQRFSDISSGTKEKQQPSLIQRVETMTSVIELLLETLKDLSDRELEMFKEDLECSLNSDKHISVFQLMLLQKTGDMQDTVFLMVQHYGQKSVEMIKKVLKEMKRTDLVQRLSDSSSGPEKKQSVDEHLSALIHKVATMAAVEELLLETFSDLSYEELKNFKWFLQFTFFQRNLPQISWSRLQSTDWTEMLVDVMMETCGQQSVEVTREIFMDMNRTDVVQRLSESSSGPKVNSEPDIKLDYGDRQSVEKHSVDEHWPALIQEVEAMTSVIELLLETMKDTSDDELMEFKVILLSAKCHHIRHLDTPLMLHETRDMQDTVFLMVQTFGQQSVEEFKEVLKMMERTDLVQRLSDSSSGPKNEQRSALIQRVSTIAAVKQLLLETLNDLRYEELKKFNRNRNRNRNLLQLILPQNELRNISWMLEYTEDREQIVDQMVQTFGQQSVELTREVYMNMNRTDLVQRLSKTSSELKDRQSADEHLRAQFERNAANEAVKQILWETLSDLSHKEIEKFKWLLPFTYFQRSLPQFSVIQLGWEDHVRLLVDVMVQTCGQQSVEVTEEVLRDMNRTDLLQRLSETSSQLKDSVFLPELQGWGGFSSSSEEHQSKLIQSKLTITPLQEKLLETLEDLSFWELKEFKEVLQKTNLNKGLPRIPEQQLKLAGRVQFVKLMEQIYGLQSVEVTREVLKKIKRSDLVHRLSDTSSESKEKHSEHQGASSETKVTMTSLQKKILETLEDFSDGDLEKFKHVLQFTKIKEGLPRIPRHCLELAGRVETVKLMEEIYGQQSVEVTREVLKKMNRKDLVQRLSDISSASEGASRSLELEGCGSIKQDSSDWTKLEPEVNSTDSDEAPTYSLQSETGNFECSVSGLRWANKEKVCFIYQFCSWEEHMERMENLQYMPAGPLMDITVTAGRLDEVYLPHWICIDDEPKICDKFAVLHVDDCGDVVEKVSEVTPSHVKLSEPVFSPRAVLMKVGFPVKINCNVLIYKTNTAFLTLHVYLIPRDPSLQQTLDQKESSYGYKVIRKPPPEKSLKMNDRFILTADLDGAEIYPEKLKLRYESTLSRFFEVYFEKPDTNFKLKLRQENEPQPVWTCAIRKDEYQNTPHIPAEHFVDKHQCDLIRRVNNIGPILDNLLSDGVIQQEGYETIRKIEPTQEKMRELYSGPLKAGGLAAKDKFYKILEKEESYLVADLKKES